MNKSVFAKYQSKSYPYRFASQLVARNAWGATPVDPNVAEGWIKTKLAPNDVLLREMVIEVMLETGGSEPEAVELIGKKKNLCIFRRDPDRGGEMYFEGRCLKAMLKEAASCAANAGKIPKGGTWGLTNKGLQNWFPEHVFVEEDKLYMGIKEGDDVDQSFIHKYDPSSKRMIAAIQYNERIDELTLDFTVETDHEFPEEQWALLWTTGERQGIGAGRSQGHGRFTVTKWQPIK